jgi:hypothetical protein
MERDRDKTRETIHKRDRPFSITSTIRMLLADGAEVQLRATERHRERQKEKRRETEREVRERGERER